MGEAQPVFRKALAYAKVLNDAYESDNENKYMNAIYGFYSTVADCFEILQENAGVGETAVSGVKNISKAIVKLYPDVIQTQEFEKLHGLIIDVNDVIVEAFDYWYEKGIEYGYNSLLDDDVIVVMKQSYNYIIRFLDKFWTEVIDYGYGYAN